MNCIFGCGEEGLQPVQTFEDLETFNKPYSAFINSAHCAFYSQLCVTIETVK